MKKGVNEIQEMKEEIVSIFPVVGKRELDTEEIIRRLELGIEYLNPKLVEKALNELVQEKKIWISIYVALGRYISYKIFFSSSEK